MNTYRIVVKEPEQYRKTRHTLEAPTFWDALVAAYNTWGKACVESVTPPTNSAHTAQKARAA